MEDNSTWRKKYKSICNGPLRIISEEELDDSHPAKIFNNYWMSLGNGKVPNKANFRPETVSAILKWFMVFRQEIHKGEDLYYLKLQGTAAAELTCGLLQGKYLHEFTTDECFSTRRELMRKILKEEKPGFASLDLKENNSEFYTEVTVGMFPMKDKGGDAIFLLPAPTETNLRSLL